MRKLALACALAAAALFAQGVQAEDAAGKAKQTGSQATGAVRKTGQRWREAAGRAVNGSAKSADARAFEGKKNFDVDGKVQKVSKGSITIARDGLPPATLDMAHGTKVQLDGNDASIQQLAPGQDVKASFNLAGDKPEAVEIQAKRASKK